MLLFLDMFNVEELLPPLTEFSDAGNINITKPRVNFFKLEAEHIVINQTIEKIFRVEKVSVGVEQN